MCLYGTFIVRFSIFLVSITLVLEISKLLIECFHGNLTPNHFIRKMNQLRVVILVI